MPFRPPNTLPTKNPKLECENQVGSLNANPTPPATVTGTTGPYVPPDLCVGQWQITGIDPDVCAQNEMLNQQSYVAESLNISGAPINIYPLLGVHQQGGSVLSEGVLISSPSAPGYPLSGLNQPGQVWRSLQAGAAVAGNAYLGIDFGWKLLTKDNQPSEYAPPEPNWKDVGAFVLTQSNNPGFYATQVRVETTTGTVKPAAPTFTGVGNGTLVSPTAGSESTQGLVIAQATSSTSFNVYVKLPSGTMTSIGTATVGIRFLSTFLNFTILAGTIPFSAGDMFNVVVNYEWNRAGVFNVIQSPSPQVLNLNTKIKVKAARVVPIMFLGSGNWEVSALDILSAPPASKNVIQDLFFNENRDRDYSTTPVMLKCAYTPADSISDLSKFGLSILDQYVFTCSYATMVSLLGRPIVVGDLIEVIPELQYDQNLLPIRKFLEVSDSGWAASGFGPQYNPTVYRFTAQQALPAQETRDIFGTMDTEKYLASDAIFNDGIGQQLDITPLTRTEEISKNAADRVPEVGSDDNRSVELVPTPQAGPPRNARGQPPAEPNPPPSSHQNLYIEDGLPPNGEPYGEGFTLPAVPGPADGDWFRLYYPPETQIPPRLFRFSQVKMAWVFMQMDRRGQYTTAKPSVRQILESPNRTPMNKKRT